MYRHSPNRHQKSKGFRLKHVLQICVLVGVCFWLIYQVKHYHDKRKQFDENDAKTSRDVEVNNAVLKLGRKDLNPVEKGPNKDLESHDEEAEEEVEEDKNEEENGEQDKNEEEIRHVEEIEEEDKHEEESEEEDKHEEETGEEETGEDKHEEETGEEDKHEEENGEEDKHEEETGDKHEIEEGEDIETEEKGDEGRGGGDDGVSEQEQEKADSNVNQEEEFIEEEKDKEDTDEKETEDKDEDDKDSQQKNDSSIEDHDHDEGSKNTREAREEQYKGDDASSAVTHDGHITSTENVIGSMGNQASTEEHKNKHNNTEEGNTGQNITDVNGRELEAAGNGNLTSDEEKSSEVLDSLSRGNSSLTSITTLESNVQSETINNTVTPDSSIRNETEIIMSDLSHSHTAAEGTNFETLVLEQSDNSTVALENTKLDSNLSNSTATKNVEENPEEYKDSSKNSEFVSSETLAQSNVSAENKDGSESTTTVESTNEGGNENPENIEGTEGTYVNSDSSNTVETDEVQHDSVDDKEDHIDLDTLPDIRTEGSNSEEVAEE